MVRHIIDPKIFGVRLSMVVNLYRRRLRAQLIQEILAGSGVAAGVALVFGVLVANASIGGSASEVVHQVIGSAQLQLAARSPDGFDSRLGDVVRKLPDIRHSASILRADVAVVGRDARRSVQLLGVTDGVVALGSLGTRYFGQGGFRFAGGLLLPASIAGAIGAEAGDRVTILASGQAHTIKVGAVLDRSPFGALASSPVAITLLPFAQSLVGHPGRLTQVLIEPGTGAKALVMAELQRIAQPRLNVVAADNELRLLEQAAKPTSQSTTLFTAISAMVGFLLAVTAMLLTVPQRRRSIADLRMQGYDRRQIVLLLGFQALVLGIVASVAGVALGDILSLTFHNIPAYLASAFPIGTQQVLHVKTVFLALACGVLATLLASLAALFDLRASRASDAVLRDPAGGGEVISRRTTQGLSLVGTLLIVLVTSLVLNASSLTIVGGVALGVSTLCLIPAFFAAAAKALLWTSEHLGGSALGVAASELRATTTRSVALAAIAGLAVYGSVAIGGARDDLLRGLDRNFAEYLRTADLWVTTGGNDLTTNSFHASGAAATIARTPGIASVRDYQGGLLDVGSRRMWIIARPPQDGSLIPASQLLKGELARATQRLREGVGWAAVSNGFAAERLLRVGDYFLLPTPSGSARLRVAAITTNLGWSPGAIILTTGDYQRLWQTANPSALEINLKPAVFASAMKRRLDKALGAWPGLRVQTMGERKAQYAVDSRQGLQALGEISTLLQIAAALAVAFALSAVIRQRRARLASLKIQGYDMLQLWRALLLETAVILGVGCAVGAVFGVYGHALAGRWLRLTTGFPAPFSLGLGQVGLTLALVCGIALVVVAIPGFAAARVSARASLEEQL
jgi:putative ABC transport system permease protein